MTSDRIVLASNNAGKLREFQALLRNWPIQVLRQAELGVSEAEETGLTFIENALLKARHAATVTGLPALADDSGLEVDALHGAPGIYSARYAGVGSSDGANVSKLLAALADTPPDRRLARFRCVLVYLRHAHDPAPLVCEGIWAGQIAPAPAGVNGFGYDPVFYLPDLAQTAAQLPEALKNQLSHRGQALRLLQTRLAAYLA